MKLRSGILCLLTFISFGAHAFEVANLYQVDIPVDNRSAEARDRALSAGLEEALIRASGNPRVADVPAIQSQLARADSFVQQYGYQHNPVTNALELEAQYAKEAVLQLLQNAKQPLWSTNRPLVMMWFAVEDSDGRYIVTDDTVSASQAIHRRAKQRGLPILFPLMDLEDQIYVDVSTVWGRFPEKLERPSERYAPDMIAIGRVFKNKEGLWAAQWMTPIDGKQQRFEKTAPSKDDVFAAVVDTFADRLSKRYAVDTHKKAERVRVTITDIHSVLDYARVEDHLRNLASVRDMDVIEVAPDSAVFEVSIRGGGLALSKALSLDESLFPETRDDLDSEKVGLAYRWMSHE